MRRIVLDAQYSVMTSALTMALKHGRPDFQVQNAGPKTKDYLFAMNGQTGKLVGDLPVDKRKVAAWFAGISVPLMILLAFLL